MPFLTSAASYSSGGAAPGQLIEFMHGKLYYTWTGQDLSVRNATSVDTHFFSIDNVLVYLPFYADFGPSNIAHLYRFICMLEAKLKEPALFNKRIVLYSTLEQDKRANAAFLMSAYMMVVHKKQPEDAHRPLVGISPPLMPFRDAGSGPATYFLSVLDCLKGLHKAMVCGLFSFATFNLEEYERHERVEYGDFNWLTPKFLAFASPMDNPASNPARATWTPTLMAEYFAKHKVQVVVRLNNKLYDKAVFTKRGIEHVELYFPDGSCPPEPILKKFLDLCESREGSVAVHCKAGLGRTGSLIGAYLMKHYQFTASEVIGFLRIMRPGSVVGPQQNWLHHKQRDLLRSEESVARPLAAHLAAAEERAAPQPMAVDSPPQSPSATPVQYAAIPAQPRKFYDPSDPYTVVGGTPSAVNAVAAAPLHAQTAAAIANGAAIAGAQDGPRYNLRSLQGAAGRVRTAAASVATAPLTASAAAAAASTTPKQAGAIWTPGPAASAQQQQQQQAAAGTNRPITSVGAAKALNMAVNGVAGIAIDASAGGRRMSARQLSRRGNSSGSM